MTSSTQSLSTKGIHADHSLATNAVAADISTTTTFRHPDPDVIADYDKDWDPANPSRHVYSREGQPTVQRAEKVLSELIGHPTILFPSGISAFFALLLHHNPDVIAFGTKDGPGYHGCHGAIDIFRKTKGEDRVSEIYMDDDFPNDGRKVLMWLETPLNPFGTSFSIEHYAKKVHAIPGGILGVDSTFAPPGIQDPFSWGADIVMHSATKYLAGHSDALVGTLSVRTQDEWRKLWNIRTYTGSNSGSLDTWLLLRSLRTFHVRTSRQFKTATLLVKWLESLTEKNHSGEEDGTKGFIKRVWHTSLQENAGDLVAEDGSKQMTKGPACFSILMTKEIYAEWLGPKLQLFFNATSLGGVESLIEQRKISDSHCDPCLVRLSIGLEDLEDLKADFIQAFKQLSEIEKEKASNTSIS